MEKNVLKKINGNFKGKDILSLDQFDTSDLFMLFKHTDAMKAVNNKPSQILAGNIVSLLFFEPSSRTFNSFEAAVKRLGGEVLSMQDTSVTSLAKGETFEDTIKVYEAYSDVIIIRAKEAGRARQAADAAFFIP